MQELLNTDELATILNMSKRQVYTLCEKRGRTKGSMKDNPLPMVRINGNLRFRRESIEGWIRSQEQTVVAPQETCCAV